MDLFDSTSNYVKITGVQLEIGDHATDFEHVPYCDELQRCKRYYQTASYTTLMGSASGAVSTPRILFEVEMRAAPNSVETAYSSNANGSGRGSNGGKSGGGKTVEPFQNAVIRLAQSIMTSVPGTTIEEAMAQATRQR